MGLIADQHQDPRSHRQLGQLAQPPGLCIGCMVVLRVRSWATAVSRKRDIVGSTGSALQVRSCRMPVIAPIGSSDAVG